MKPIGRISAACIAVLLVAGIAFAQGTETKQAKAAKPKLATFLIESPHTEEECMMVMDEVNKSKQLAAWDWGCMAGNHTAYRIVRAADENAALAMVPADVRAKAKAHKLVKMTPAQLEAAHGHK